MADTVAVMNKGRIEQLGHPADIYETPKTVFVANFLGQANLILGSKAGESADSIAVSAHGHTFDIPRTRNAAMGSSVIVGVRPEKITVIDDVPGAVVPDHVARVHGKVTDVSYTGVSTQYLVLASWGQELICFEQNIKVGDRCSVGDDVILFWAPEHTFGLDGSEGLHAGISHGEVRLKELNLDLVREG